MPTNSVKRTLNIRPETAAALDEIAPPNMRRETFTSWIEEALDQNVDVSDSRGNRLGFIQIQVDPQYVAEFAKFASNQGTSLSGAGRHALDALLAHADAEAVIAATDFVPTGYQSHGTQFQKISVLPTLSQTRKLAELAKRGISTNVVMRAAIRTLVQKERIDPTPRRSAQGLPNDLSISLAPETWQDLDQAAGEIGTPRAIILRDIIESRTADVEKDVFNRQVAAPPSYVVTVQGNNSVVRALSSLLAAGERSTFVREAIDSYYVNHAGDKISFNRGGESNKTKAYLPAEINGELLRVSAYEQRPPAQVALAATAEHLIATYGAAIDPPTATLPQGRTAFTFG